MPASNEYGYYYFLGMSAPAPEDSVAEPAQSITNTVHDTEDGLEDGSTQVGQAMGWSQSLNGVELVGFASNGDPIVKSGGVIPSYFLLSDSAGWQGQPLGATTTGTYTYCFLPGSQIATMSGEATVETLRIGDRVKTVDGRAIPIKWIGRQTVSTRFGPAERLMPVRFATGSLGDGLPHTDLTVTADHGMLVDGVICHAGALVNGTTITWVPLAKMGDRYTVYHVETEVHEIIFANGAPAETYIDNVSRRAFDNFTEYKALYGDEPEMLELPYPRAMSARQVPQRITRRLAAGRTV